MTLPKAVKTRRTREFTTAEVGAMLDLTDVQVNNLVDDLTQLGLAHSKDRKRTVAPHGLFALKLCRDLTNWGVGPEIRHRAIQAALEAPRKKSISISGTNIHAMHVDNYRQEARDRMRVLYDAEKGVSCKPDIMRGELCIKGTRIPVYTVAEIAEIDGFLEAKQTYPQLTDKQIRAAHLYARAHPRRGRPKQIKWPMGRAIRGRSRSRTVTVD